MRTTTHNLEFLAVTRDELLMRSVLRAGAGWKSSHCDTAAAAVSAVLERRFDFIVVDCDDLFRGTEVVKSARASRPNRSSVILAIVNGGTAPADVLDLGASAVEQKPFSDEKSTTHFRRVLQMCSPDQRTTTRIPLETEVFVTTGSVVARRAVSMNVGTGGMALRLPEPVQDDDMIQLKFWLPGLESPLQAIGEVAWCDNEGHLGVKFLSMAPKTKANLQLWTERYVIMGQPYATQSVPNWEHR